MVAQITQLDISWEPLPDDFHLEDEPVILQPKPNIITTNISCVTRIKCEYL